MRQRTERQWIKSGLTVNKYISKLPTWLSVPLPLNKISLNTTRILACSTSRQFYNIQNSPLGKSESSPLPSNVHPSRLPRAFSNSFANKIDEMRHSRDTASTSLTTCNDAQFLGRPLTACHPASETTVKNIIRQSSFTTCELDPLAVSFFNQTLDTLLLNITTVIKLKIKKPCCLVPFPSPSNLQS